MFCRVLEEATMANHPTAPVPASDLETPRETDEAGHGERQASPPEFAPASRSPLGPRLTALGQRRTFLIDSRSQLRAGFLTATCALILLLLLNLSLYSARRTVTEGVLADSPELGKILHAQNRVELALVVTASVVFLLGVFVVTVLETHKTAGAAYNLARHMAVIEYGQYGGKVRLRKDDNLRELESAFNAMSDALARRALREAEELDELARDAERLGAPEASRLVERLRTRAAELRELSV
jgi:hypothetical protein